MSDKEDTKTEEKKEKGKKKEKKAAAPKNVCPISAADFEAHAHPLPVIIDGKELSAKVKTFSTGSFGWSLTGQKLKKEVNGVEVTYSVSVNFTVANSKPKKEAKKEIKKKDVKKKEKKVKEPAKKKDR